MPTRSVRWKRLGVTSRLLTCNALATPIRLNSRGPYVDHTTLGGSCRLTCRTYRSTVISKKDGSCKMAATRCRTSLAKLDLPKNAPSTISRIGRRSRPCACNAARIYQIKPACSQRRSGFFSVFVCRPEGPRQKPPRRKWGQFILEHARRQPNCYRDGAVRPGRCRSARGALHMQATGNAAVHDGFLDPDASSPRGDCRFGAIAGRHSDVQRLVLGAKKGICQFKLKTSTSCGEADVSQKCAAVNGGDALPEAFLGCETCIFRIQKNIQNSARLGQSIASTPRQHSTHMHFGCWPPSPSHFCFAHAWRSGIDARRHAPPHPSYCLGMGLVDADQARAARRAPPTVFCYIPTQHLG